MSEFLRKLNTLVGQMSHKGTSTFSTYVTIRSNESILLSSDVDVIRSIFSLESQLRASDGP